MFVSKATIHSADHMKHEKKYVFQPRFDGTPSRSYRAKQQRLLILILA
jgi:hypothetical protein